MWAIFLFNFLAFEVDKLISFRYDYLISYTWPVKLREVLVIVIIKQTAYYFYSRLFHFTKILENT